MHNTLLMLLFLFPFTLLLFTGIILVVRDVILCPTPVKVRLEVVPNENKKNRRR